MEYTCYVCGKILETIPCEDCLKTAIEIKPCEICLKVAEDNAYECGREDAEK